MGDHEESIMRNSEFVGPKTFPCVGMHPKCPNLDDGPFTLRIGYESVDIIQGEVIYQIMFQDILSWGVDKNPEQFHITCTVMDEVSSKVLIRDYFSFYTEQNQSLGLQAFIMGRVLKLMEEMKTDCLQKEKFKELCDALEALYDPDDGEDGLSGNVKDYIDIVTAHVSGVKEEQGLLTARQCVTLLRRFAPRLPFGVLHFTDAVHRLMRHRDSTQLLVSVFPSNVDRENFIHTSQKIPAPGVEVPPRIFVKTRSYPDLLAMDRPTVEDEDGRVPKEAPPPYEQQGTDIPEEGVQAGEQ